MSRNSDRIEKLRERVQAFYDAKPGYHSAPEDALLESAMTLLDNETARANAAEAKYDGAVKACAEIAGKLTTAQKKLSQRR